MAEDIPASKAPTPEAKALVKKDFSKQVASLSEQRVVNRAFLRKAVGDFDPEYITLPRLYQMRKDPMIQMGMHYCKFPLIRAKWHIECEDPQIGGSVEEIIRRVYGAYTRMMLNKLDFGYQAGIKQFELGEIHGTYEDKRGAVMKLWPDEMVAPMMLAPPLPLPPEYVSPKIKEGKFAGINSALGIGMPGEDGDRFVPPEWSLWSTNEFEENFRNYFGYPRIGYAYRYWWSYWFRFHMEDRHFEMDADPALQIKYPKGESPDTNGKMRSNRDLALEIGNDLRGGATIAWPSEPYYDEQGKPSAISLWEADFLQGGENLKAFRESSEYLDIMKLRAVLVPEQALVEGKGGTSSRNVAATYGDIFRESLGQEGDDLDDIWNRYIIPDIVEANWGSKAPKCTKVTTGFEDEDLTLANELITLAFAADPNALPIDFDELVKQSHLPIMSVKEQKERTDLLEEKAEEEKQAAEVRFKEAQAAGMGDGKENPADRSVKSGAGRAPTVGSGGGGLPADYSAGGSAGFSLHLHRGELPIQSTAPEWAKIESARREANINGLAERLQRDLEARYRAVLEDVAVYIEHEGEGQILTSASLALAFSDRRRVKKFLNFYGKLKDDVVHKTGTLNAAVQSEVASIYQASGAAELVRIGQEVEDWDVRREDIQDWANMVVGRMLSQSDDSLLEIHIKPWLEKEFEGESYKYDPNPSLSLAQRFRVKFLKHPEWMAKRTARTEARTTYNNASLDVWELSGIKHVRAYDGLGGVTGRTDEKCLSRNGKIMSIAEARREDADEHPNGTLGFVPVIEETVFRLSQVPLVTDARRSATIYTVDSDGYILFQDEADAA